MLVYQRVHNLLPGVKHLGGGEASILQLWFGSTYAKPYLKGDGFEACYLTYAEESYTY